MRTTGLKKRHSQALIAAALACVGFPRTTADAPIREGSFRDHGGFVSPAGPPASMPSANGNIGFSTAPIHDHPPSSLFITSANNGQTFQNMKIISKTGNCITISGATNITIQNMEIGPCAGRGIEITKSSGVNIYDNYIHSETLSAGCCDNNDGIYAHNDSKDILVQGNVIAYGESNVEGLGVARIRVVGNFLLNPRGPKPRGQNFQCYNGCSEVTVSDNYALSSTDSKKYLYPENQEDSINFGMSDGVIARGNFITGGHSRSGCGMIADDRANSVQFAGNRILDTGQCGIGIADGTNQEVSGNKIHNTNPVEGGGNTALQVWKQYKPACGPVTVSGNIADALKPDGSHSGYWNGGGCEPVSLTGNTFDAAAEKLLTPISKVFDPPSIPPQPKHCVASSPYSNNTFLPRCNSVN